MDYGRHGLSSEWRRFWLAAGGLFLRVKGSWILSLVLWIPLSLITSTVIAHPLSLLVGWEGGSGHGGLSSETGLSGSGSQVPLCEGERVLLALSLHRAPRGERQLQKATLCRFLATHHTTLPVA